MNIFDRCMVVIFKNEGGYVWHKSDPGGETKYGIARKFFPDEDIKNLTKARAKELYHEHFWQPMSLEGIDNESLVLHIFDFGINAGRSRSVRLIQRIVNARPIDGVCGPITRGKINAFKPVTRMESGEEIEYSVLDLFKQERKIYYTNLARRKPSLKVFLKGWLNRVEKCKFA